MKYIVIILILLVVYLGYCDYKCTKENFVDGGKSGIYQGTTNPNEGNIVKVDSPIDVLNKINSTEQFNVNNSQNKIDSKIISTLPSNFASTSNVNEGTKLTVNKGTTSNINDATNSNVNKGTTSNINEGTTSNINEDTISNVNESTNKTSVKISNIPNLSNYILKSEAQKLCPNQPDMSKYILKTNIPQCKENKCPDLSKYTLKTHINVKDCPRVKDLSKYILKTEIPIITDSEKALNNYLSLKNNLNRKPIQPSVQPPAQPSVQPPAQPSVQPPAQPSVQPPAQPSVHSNNSIGKLVNNTSHNVSKFILNEIGKRVNINQSIGEILISFFDKNNDKSLTRDEITNNKADVKGKSLYTEKKMNELSEKLCDKICNPISQSHEAYINNLLQNNVKLKELNSKKDIVLGDVAMAILDKNSDNKITESEINDLIQKSVEISILLGIKELCKTCKNISIKNESDKESPNNFQDKSSESVDKKVNKLSQHLLSPPGNKPESALTQPKKNVKKIDDTVQSKSNTKSVESFMNYPTQYNDINNVSNQYQRVSYPKCNQKLPPSNARQRHPIKNRCNIVKKQYHVVYGPY